MRRTGHSRGHGRSAATHGPAGNRATQGGPPRPPIRERPGLRPLRGLVAGRARPPRPRLPRVARPRASGPPSPRGDRGAAAVTVGDSDRGAPRGPARTFPPRLTSVARLRAALASPAVGAACDAARPGRPDQIRGAETGEPPPALAGLIRPRGSRTDRSRLAAYPPVRGRARCPEPGGAANHSRRGRCGQSGPIIPACHRGPHGAPRSDPEGHSS